MKWNKLYEYPASMRTSVEGKRHYEITGKKLQQIINHYDKLPLRYTDNRDVRVHHAVSSDGNNILK